MSLDDERRRSYRVAPFGTAVALVLLALSVRRFRKNIE